MIMGNAWKRGRSFMCRAFILGNSIGHQFQTNGYQECGIDNSMAPLNTVSLGPVCSTGGGERKWLHGIWFVMNPKACVVFW
jgi:hypothetical protein